MKRPVSIVDAVKADIIREVEQAKRRIIDGMDVEDEFRRLVEHIEGVMNQLDLDIRLIINSFW